MLTVVVATQPWTREAHWNEASTQSRGTRGASCMIRWSIWLHMAADSVASPPSLSMSLSSFGAATTP
jgi:hypothetical protein